MTSSARIAFCALTSAAFYGAVSAAPPAKTPSAATKTAPAAPGVAVEGSGVCSFQAAFAKGNSNVLATPFQAVTRSEKDRIVSSSRATSNREVSAVVNLIQAAPEEIGELRRVRAMTLSFGSRRGFRAGQIIPITLPKRNGQPTCLMDYVENEVVERQLTRPSGRTTTRKTSKYRSWIATSGTLRIDAVSEKGLFFTVKNARFTVPSFGRATNYADGSFVLQGKGSSTFDED